MNWYEDYSRTRHAVAWFKRLHQEEGPLAGVGVNLGRGEDVLSSGW